MLQYLVGVAIFLQAPCTTRCLALFDDARPVFNMKKRLCLECHEFHLGVYGTLIQQMFLRNVKHEIYDRCSVHLKNTQIFI